MWPNLFTLCWKFYICGTFNIWWSNSCSRIGLSSILDLQCGRVFIQVNFSKTWIVFSPYSDLVKHGLAFLLSSSVSPKPMGRLTLAVPYAAKHLLRISLAINTYIVLMGHHLTKIQKKYQEYLWNIALNDKDSPNIFNMGTTGAYPGGAEGTPPPPKKNLHRQA